MDVYPGLIVKSTAGREKDKFFVVLDIVDDIYCLIADGRTRKVDMPKKKKIKHLIATDVCSEGIKDKLKTAQTVTNSMVRKELKSFEDFEM
ncbi:MAG: KOW domain-containing RNA-binding protein [Clostridia bacterium]|nr:KOW domain-containing RNA-binding protein [Clostridia bacterium]